MTGQSYAEAVGHLRAAMNGARENRFYQEIIQSRDAVLARFQPVFSSDHLPQLDEAEVKAFLRMENNKHWSGLHRQGNRICADMAVLRRALDTLLDETQPLPQRLDYAVTSVQGLGKAIATAILLVAYPSKYGVWNNISEEALRKLGIFPSFQRGESIGQRYERVNNLLIGLSAELNIDLWTLDALFWYFVGSVPDSDAELPNEVVTDEAPAFGLERHLQEFLRDNWECTELGRDWVIFGETGDPEVGYEYPTDVGRIDILAHHRSKPEWLVIELKRGQTTDTTLGQVLRYIGWVRHNLAQSGERVRGLIISREADQALLYALATVPDVELRLYKVTFSLHPAPNLGKDSAPEGLHD